MPELSPVRVYMDPEPFTNDPAVFRRWVGSLSVLGWQPRYVAEAVGCEREIEYLTRRKEIPEGEAARVYEFFCDYRDQYATKRPGLTIRQICDVRRYGRNQGWLTPDWYCPDGTVMSVREHRIRESMWVKRNRAFEGLEVLRLIVKGLPDEKICAQLGLSRNQVLYWRGARARVVGHIPDGRTWTPLPAYRARFREVELGVARYFADPDADPHITLYDLGIFHDRAIRTYREILAKQTNPEAEQIAS